MEQELRFGLDLGRLAILKIKNLVNYEQLLRAVYSCFHGQFFFLLNIVAVKSCIKRLKCLTRLLDHREIKFRPTKTTCRGCFGSQISKYVASDSRESRDLG